MLFQAGQPVLAGMDLDSIYCYLLAPAAHRDAETWGIHRLDLLHRASSRVENLNGRLRHDFFLTHSVTVDRPADKGGTDLGFAGGELFVAGLGGCYMSNLIAAAQGRDIPVRTARLRARGLLAESPLRITEFILEVELDADCDDETADKLLLIAERSCIVSNTVKQGTTLTVRRIIP